jgi:dienelactone hydrolase
MYPHCLKPVPINTPTLILSGEMDQWNPANLCAQYVDNLQPQHNITLKVFAGAYHAFDEPGVDDIEAGYIVRYYPEAAAKASELSRKFLAERL